LSTKKQRKKKEGCMSQKQGQCRGVNTATLRIRLLFQIRISQISPGTFANPYGVNYNDDI
jgi:hypothetical protein